MLREIAKTNRAPLLMRSGGYTGFHYWCESNLKSIIDRYVFMYAQVVLRYPQEICAGDWMMHTLEYESDLIL